MLWFTVLIICFVFEDRVQRLHGADCVYAPHRHSCVVLDLAMSTKAKVMFYPGVLVFA